MQDMERRFLCYYRVTCRLERNHLRYISGMNGDRFRYKNIIHINIRFNFNFLLLENNGPEVLLEGIIAEMSDIIDDKFELTR